jgi:DNA-binding transcriptional LysR family regulator
MTDDGRAFFSRCVQILGDLEETEDAMAKRSVTPQGRLRISLPIAFGHRHVMNVIREYVEAWPDVSVNVSFTDRFVDLIDEGVDIALRIGGPRADSGLITRVVAHERLVLCASPAYLARRAVPVTVADLKEHECLFFVNGSHVVPWVFKDDTQFRGDGRMLLNSADAIQELAVAGFGVARLPTYLIAPDLRAGRLLPLLQELEREADPIRVVYPTRQHLSPKVRLFIDLLAQRWSRRAPG